MNEFIGYYKKRAKARYKRRNERALARFSWQRPISIGGDGGKQVIIGIAGESFKTLKKYYKADRDRV